MATIVRPTNILLKAELSYRKHMVPRVMIVGLERSFDNAARAVGQQLLPQIYFSRIMQRPEKLLRCTKWSIQSSVDGSGVDPSSANSTGNSTRLISVIQGIQTNLDAKIQDLRRNLPMKLLFFLVGFYCATAFATMIGQTGDWDILSAALAVVVVEGIGALMYKASFRILNRARSMITMFNYWKAGLSLGLFMDSFKYDMGEMADFHGSILNFEVDLFPFFW